MGLRCLPSQGACERERLECGSGTKMVLPSFPIIVNSWEECAQSASSLCCTSVVDFSFDKLGARAWPQSQIAQQVTTDLSGWYCGVAGCDGQARSRKSDPAVPAEALAHMLNAHVEPQGRQNQCTSTHSGFIRIFLAKLFRRGCISPPSEPCGHEPDTHPFGTQQTRRAKSKVLKVSLSLCPPC